MDLRAKEDEEGEEEGSIEEHVEVNGTGVNHVEQSRADRINTKSRPGPVYYKPAYELEDDAAERLGRDW